MQGARKSRRPFCPEQDDEFVKDVSEFETLDELQGTISKSRFLKRKGRSGIQSAFENAVLEKAAGQYDGGYPRLHGRRRKSTARWSAIGYQLQMNGMSLKQYSEMMGGNLDALRDSMKGMAEAKVKQMVLLDAVAEAEKVEVTADDIAEEYKKLADSYKMDEEKVKQMLSEDDIKGNLESRKAAKLIVDAAVAVAPVEEKAEEAAAIEGRRIRERLPATCPKRVPVPHTGRRAGSGHPQGRAATTGTRRPCSSSLNFSQCFGRE